jgi:FlaA1/EpsC-like NDP-sugar epimerase
MKQIYSEKEYPAIRYFIGDVRDYDRLLTATKNVDIIFHAAAMKQVDTIEYNPLEAIKTNIYGTENIIKAAIQNKVKKVK